MKKGYATNGRLVMNDRHVRVALKNCAIWREEGSEGINFYGDGPVNDIVWKQVMGRKPFWKDDPKS